MIECLQLSQQLKVDSKRMAVKKKVCVVSPSSSANLSVNKTVPERFKLGMCDWTDSDSEKELDEDFQPPKKAATQSLLLRKSSILQK